MNADWFLCVRSALLLLLLVLPLPLLAQESAPVGTHAAPRSNTAKRIVAPAAPSLERNCLHFLAPYGTGPIRERLLRADEELVPRFAFDSDEDLDSAVELLKECIVGLPNRSLRRDALDAYDLARNEIERRADTFLSDLHEEADKKREREHAAELEKQRADFWEVARFTVAIYKEDEQRKVEELSLLAAFNEESERYRNLYDAVQRVLNVAGQLLNGSSRSSLPAFVEVPVPQLIRVQTPAVPRALNCSANTTPNLSMSSVVSTSTTWINCWQY